MLGSEGGEKNMENIMDQLQEMLEERVHALLINASQEDKERSQDQKSEHVKRVEAIMNQLSDEDREWLDNLLVSKGVLLDEKAQSLYKAGFCDALKLMKALEI